MGGKAILLVTVGFGTILWYIMFNISGMSTRSVENMSNYAMATESHNLSTTGANVALSKFYQDTSWFGTITQSFPSDGGESGGGSAGLTGSFTATMTDLGGGNARLRSVSTYYTSMGGVLHDTTEIYFDTDKYDGFELYAWMSNFEGNMFWITGDTIQGKAHSNGNIHINGSPVWGDKVTTAKGFNPKPGTGANQAVYQNGYETGVATIQFPTDLTDLTDAASSGGRYYTDEIWVTLTEGSAADNDGWVYVRETQAGPVIDSVQLNDPGFNGALVSTDRVNIQGTLDGELTVGTLNDAYVQDDILYDNRDYQNSNDVFGLVAESDVFIANASPNLTNCEIDGSIFCRTGSLLVEGLNSRGLNGYLKVTGSIVMEEHGEIGKYAGSNLNKGYYKRFFYDDRLADGSFRPPFYPGFYVTKYSIANWWENVRIPEYTY